MHIHWNFGGRLISSITDRAMETLPDTCRSSRQLSGFPINLLLTCHCLTPREVSSSTYLLYKINCAAFPITLASRHLHRFRTLRSINVRCTSRGHNRHSPLRIATRQLASRSVLYHSPTGEPPTLSPRLRPADYSTKRSDNFPK